MVYASGLLQTEDHDAVFILKKKKDVRKLIDGISISLNKLKH